MLKRPRHVHVLIDWNSELHALNHVADRDSADVARRALKQACRRVGKLLHDRANGEPFFLFIRAYHGWRAGFEKTKRRHSLDAARVYNPSNPEDRGLTEYSPRPNQILRALEFGDKLVGARQERLCGPARDHHLPKTIQKDAAGDYCEKMVDTAIVSDLIYLASEDNDSWLVVIGQDADLVPGILTAEGLLYGTDRQLVFLARGGYRNSNPTIGDLICKN